MISQVEGRKPTPSPNDWANEPFEGLLNQVQRLQQLLHLSTTGITMLVDVPRLVEALAKRKGEDNDDAKSHIERAKADAALAKREVDEGFPLSHAQSAIALWSSLEAAVRLFLAQWLRYEKTAKDVEIVQKLKIRLGDYERLSEEERCFFIVERLEQEIASPLSNGVGRFEALLAPFGLDGPVADWIRRDLFELSQVRNALAHQSMKADKRLVEACPWMGLTVGAPLLIGKEHTQRYFVGVLHYAVELVIRIGEHFGDDMTEHRKQQREDEEKRKHG